MKYTAFLRGINVGGHNIIKMTLLKEMFITLGFTNVITLLQSGNIIFEAKENDINVISKKLSQKINSTFNLTVQVFIKRHNELKEMVNNLPFDENDIQKSFKFYIMFLETKPDNEIIKSIEELSTEYETIKVKGNDIYILIHKIRERQISLYCIPLIEKRLKNIAGTVRDIKTIRKVVLK